MNTGMPGRLPVLLIVRNAVLIPWQKRAVMFRALLPLTTIIIVFEMAASLFAKEGMGPGTIATGFACTLLSVAALVLFAIVCHRLVLLGDHSVPTFGLMTWSGRETRYVGWILLGAISGFFLFCLSGLHVAGLQAVFGTLSKQINYVLFGLAALPCLYVVSRFSVLLPATAIDERRNVAWAWKTTEANGGRLLLLIWLLPLTAYQGLGLLGGHSLLLDFVFCVISRVLNVIEVAMLSLSYHYLVSGGIPAAAEIDQLGSAVG